MDLLSKRYANPCFFMDGMIRTGRFCDFVNSIVRTTNEEENEQRTWEYFLHRVFDKSFDDFKQALIEEQKERNMPEETIETTYQYSMKILNNFSPEQGGE